MIAAWAHSLEDGDIKAFLNRIPGLGAVLYPRNYPVARTHVAIGYVPTVAAARIAMDYPFRGFILGRDEPNVPDKYRGPSGGFLPPSESKRQFDAINDILRDHPAWRVPAALAPVYSFWRYIFCATTFDDEYQRARGAPSVAWTPTKVRKREIARVRREYAGHQVIAPAPYIGLNRFFIPSPSWHVRFAMRHDRTHTAFWSLQSAKSQVGKHGLFTRDGRMTRVGREIREALRDV